MSRSRHQSKKRAPAPRPTAQAPAESTSVPMGFGIFRKHQRLMLGIAVVFTIVAFALFPSDMSSALRQGDDRVIGRFEVAGGGEVVDVTSYEYWRVSQDLARLRGEVTADDIWTHLMVRADARAAGVMVADDEFQKILETQLDEIFGLERQLTLAEYVDFVRRRGFNSPADFEHAFREQLLVQRYLQFRSMASRVVPADDVYLRWRVDNELFDLAAVVFDDLPLEDVPEPGPDELRAWYDAMSEGVRTSRFQDPAKRDIVYASLPLDADVSALPAERLAAIAEPSDAQIEQRFAQVKGQRYPELEAPTDEVRAELGAELRVIEYVQSLWTAFMDEPVESQTAERFVELATSFGLDVADPQGLLTPDEIEALEDVGDVRLANWVRYVEPGNAQFVRPFGDTRHALAFFVQEGVEAKPLSFEEGRETIVEAWKEEHRDAPAQRFREALEERARALPQVQEEIAPILAEAEQAAADRIAAAPEDDAPVDAEAVRAEELERVEPDIADRVAQYEHLVWDEVLAAAEGYTLVQLQDVPRSYAARLDGDEEAEGIERFLKTNAVVFRTGVDGITPVLRSAPLEKSAVVRVTGRDFPEQDAMFADPESMDRARRALAMQRRYTLAEEFSPEALRVAHRLQLVEAEVSDEEGDAGADDEGEPADDGDEGGPGT